MRSRRWLPVAALLLAAISSRAHASCAEGASEQCLLGLCACVPAELAEHTKHTAGLMLEQWLIESRNDSIADALPVPRQIRELLAPFVRKEILDVARYRIGGQTELNLANLNLAYGDMVGNRVIAVTLIEVIVFRDEGAAADPLVWAHELHHVRQFRDWGVRDFAMRYVRDFHEVEDPAYAFGKTVASQLR
jgi:hypothetical protein